MSFLFGLNMQVVNYYVRCAKTNNHTVREAACNCMAELFTKVEKAAVRPHLDRLQRTLYRCLKDDSWTVSLQPLPDILCPMNKPRSLPVVKKILPSALWSLLGLSFYTAAL